jgi:outer membrane protein insertion porin family
MQWGEPIAVYDSALMKQTVERLSNYLFSEGYFKNKVTTRVNTIGRYVSVNYRIDAGKTYVIDTIIYNIPDTTVRNTVLSDAKNSFIKTGDHYSEDKLSKERERLDLLLKDLGFYDFSRQYIEWRVDSGYRKPETVGLMLLVHSPAQRGYHKQFIIDSVNFVTDAGVASAGVKRQSRVFRDVRYSYLADNYNLKILSQRLFVTPGEPYSRTKTFDTQRSLAGLDAFKFVNINYDTSGGKFIANIFTSPLQRYEWSNEFGVNVTQGYPGPFYSLNFKKRNVFKGLENLELNGRIGKEGVAAASSEADVFRSTEAGANASLIFPQFLWPFRDATQIRFGKYNPKTRLSIGYTYSKRGLSKTPDYIRSSTTLSNTYTWQNRRTTQFSLALTNVSLIESEISDAFRQNVLDTLEKLGNFNLINSFKPSFVSSMIFGITWNKDYGTYDKNAVFIRAQVESGGTSLNFIDTTLISKRGLQHFKYLRFNFDFRKVHVINKWATLAYRFNTGVAYSYARNRSLPYEKFYFAGGSNSVRAWRPRRLGLGSVPPSFASDPKEDGNFDYQFEKPGEILVEGSIELRSKLVGFLDGAIFVDAGNVWAFRNPRTDIQGNAQFQFNTFYKELGIGTGFGLRFDFTFLILRFDVGIKAYDPAQSPGNKFVLTKTRFFYPYARKTAENTYVNVKEPVIYNIGIGFPF